MLPEGHWEAVVEWLAEGVRVEAREGVGGVLPLGALVLLPQLEALGVEEVEGEGAPEAEGMLAEAVGLGWDRVGWEEGLPSGLALPEAEGAWLTDTLALALVLWDCELQAETVAVWQGEAEVEEDTEGLLEVMGVALWLPLPRALREVEALWEAERVWLLQAEAEGVGVGMEGLALRLWEGQAEGVAERHSEAEGLAEGRGVAERHWEAVGVPEGRGVAEVHWEAVGVPEGGRVAVAAALRVPWALGERLAVGQAVGVAALLGVAAAQAVGETEPDTVSCALRVAVLEGARKPAEGEGEAWGVVWLRGWGSSATTVRLTTRGAKVWGVRPAGSRQG